MGPTEDRREEKFYQNTTFIENVNVIGAVFPDTWLIRSYVAVLPLILIIFVKQIHNALFVVGFSKLLISL